MSGGVDSAVALHRAGAERRRGDAAALARPAGPERRAGVLLARRRDRARARRAMRWGCRTSRSTCARRSGTTSSQPFVDGYAAGLTPNPCMRCNGAFRFAAARRVRGAGRRGRALDRSLRAHRRARRDAPRRARRAILRRTSRTCSRRSIRRCSTGSRFPLGETDQGRRPGRGRRGRARRGAAAGEPGGLLPRRRRLPRVPRAARRRSDTPGAIVDEDGDGRRSP